MFVDASALVAILANEEDAARLEVRLSEAAAPITSGLAIYETVLGVRRKLQLDLPAAHAATRRLLDLSGVETVELGSREAEVALEAFARFGKGRHPARLNMGDCFAYACARTHGVPLLYKGADFALTDIAAA